MFRPSNTTLPAETQLYRSRNQACVRVAFAMACALFGFTSVATAQDPAGATLDRYHPAETVEDGFAISRPKDFGHLRWGVQLQLDYANDPLVFETRLGDRDSEIASVVEHQLVGHAIASFGLWDRLVIYGGLPVTLYSDGATLPTVPAADGTALGDPWLGARVRLLGDSKDFFSMGVQGTLTLPFAQLADGGQAYSGERTVAFLPKLLFELRPSILRINANVGARVRQNAEYGTTLEVGDELTYGVGVTIPVFRDKEADQDRLNVHVEGYGSLGFQDFGGRQTSPVEAIGGLKYHTASGWRFGAAAGPGFSRGFGSPDFRVIGMVGFSPEQKKEKPAEKSEPKAAPPADRDGDGIPDAQDQCPDQAEDRDGFEDEDGCPDPDNDKDGVPDSDDQCPNEAGPVEKQGCPAKEEGAPKGEEVRMEGEDGKTFALERIEFETNGDKILSQSEPTLEAIRKTLEENPQIKQVRIEGHTDSTGSAAYNMQLSRRRASSVKKWLVEHGVAASRLSAFGCGESGPRDSNDSDDGRQHNRRTEFRILNPRPDNQKPGKKCQPVE